MSRGRVLMQPIDSLLNFDSTHFISWSLQIELSSSCRQMVLDFFSIGNIFGIVNRQERFITYENMFYI